MNQQRWWERRLLRDWQEQLSVVLTGLFLLQYVIWIQKEDGMWLPETVAIVKLTLLATIVVEMFVRLHRALRYVLQLASLLFVTGYILDYAPVGRGIFGMHDGGFLLRNISRLQDVGFLLRDNFIQLVPFIWFALSAWFITLLTIKIMQTKWCTIMALIVTVIAFAIRDSFGTIMLWEQVAVVIFCGLLLSILRHFAELKKNHQADWSLLSRYSPCIALPVTLIILLIVFLGTLAPDVRPVVTDPYTAWNNMGGTKLSFNGRSVLLPFGGESMSGYSSDDSSLGGQLALDYTPVMSVAAPQRSYWRGETRSLYTGEGWILSNVERRTPLSSVSTGTSFPQDPVLDPSQLKTVEVTQTITMADLGKEFPVLFGAYAIDRVKSVTYAGAEPGLSPLQWSSRLSELRWIRDGRHTYPVSYTIASKVPVVNEAALRQLPLELSNRAGLEEYLRLPETLPSRVTELALQVTQSGMNMYDKAKLLEQYLSATYPYTTTPDLSKGESRDFVDRFLFEIREGYCDYYSTAMAVMARSIGIPTRWVKGYAPGEANGDGSYTVRNSDAHSWVEVYFPGYGWIEFEPTSGFSLPTYGSEEGIVAEPLPVPEPSAVPELPNEAKLPAESGIPQPEPEGSSLSRSIGWGAGAVAAAIFLSLVWVKRQRIPLLRRIRPVDRQCDTNQRAVLEFERFLRYAKQKGYSRLEHETVREAVRRWSVHGLGAAKEDLDSLLLLFEKAKYSGLRISDEELAAVIQKVQHLLKK